MIANLICMFQSTPASNLATVNTISMDLSLAQCVGYAALFALASGAFVAAGAFVWTLAAETMRRVT